MRKPVVMTLLATLPFLALAALPSPAGADEIDDLIERGAWKQARGAVAELAAKSPGDARTFYLQSRIELAFSHPDPALAAAEKAVALEPRNGRYHFQLAEVLGSTAQRAGKLKAFSLARRFKKEAEAALALDPGLDDARWSLMEFYSIAPGIVGGDGKKSRAMADEIAKRDPVRGLLAQAQLALRAKHEAEAIALYQRAVEMDPKNYPARVSLARLLGSDTQKKYDQVEAHARAALEIDPRRSGGYAILAGLYAHLERWAELDEMLARAERGIPGNLTPHYQAGRILLTDGRQLERAERYLRQYLTVEPEGSAPSAAHAHWRLGNVLEKQGRKPEALAELETSLRLNPDLDEAKKDLKRVKRG